MERRRFIAVTTTVGLTGLAGCSTGDDGTGDGTADADGGETDDDTEAADGTGDGGMRMFDPPDARFDIDSPGLSNPRTFTITHESGESIEARELLIRGEGITEGDTGPVHEIPGSGFDAADQVSPGDSFDITIRDPDAAYEVTVAWESAETGDSTVFASAKRGPMRST